MREFVLLVQRLRTEIVGQADHRVRLAILIFPGHVGACRHRHVHGIEHEFLDDDGAVGCMRRHGGGGEEQKHGERISEDARLENDA